MGDSFANKVGTICDRNKWPQPEKRFDVREGSECTIVYGSARLGNQLVTAEGNSKKLVNQDLNELLYNMITKNELQFHENMYFYGHGYKVPLEEGGALESSNSGRPPQLIKIKKLWKGKGAQERSYNKLMKILGSKCFKTCTRCDHKNFVRYITCLKCENILETEDEFSVVFCDLERADGPEKADVIQIGLVKYCYKEMKITDVLEINCWTDHEIDRWSSKHLHKLRIDRRTKKMFKNNIEVNYKYRGETLKLFDNFIAGSRALICHGAVDFVTLEANITKEKTVLENYDVIEKVDSQKFFKTVMKNDYGIDKFGMKSIVKKFGDNLTKKEYEEGLHGALVDAKSLAKIATDGVVGKRFRDWMMFEEMIDADVQKVWGNMLPYEM